MRTSEQLYKQAAIPIRAFVLCLLVLWTVQTHAQATNNDPGFHRVTAPAQITGLWKMMAWKAYFKLTEADDTHPFFADYQWFLFSKDGTLKSISSDRDIPAKDVMAMVQRSQGVPCKFEDSFVILQNNPPGKKEIWVCLLATNKREPVSNGMLGLQSRDLVMSLQHPGGRVAFVRLLRRVEP